MIFVLALYILKSLNNLLSCPLMCFSKQKLALCFPFLLSNHTTLLINLNLDHMLRKEIFTDQKYLLLLKSYDNFHNSMYLGKYNKTDLEMKKITGEDYFYLAGMSCTIRSITMRNRFLGCSFREVRQLNISLQITHYSTITHKCLQRCLSCTVCMYIHTYIYVRYKYSMSNCTCKHVRICAYVQCVFGLFTKYINMDAALCNI